MKSIIQIAYTHLNDRRRKKKKHIFILIILIKINEQKKNISVLYTHYLFINEPRGRKIKQILNKITIFY